MSIPNISTNPRVASDVIELLYKKFNNVTYSQRGLTIPNENSSRPNVFANQILNQTIMLIQE
jgi:hypothetical protein